MNDSDDQLFLHCKIKETWTIGRFVSVGGFYATSN